MKLNNKIDIINNYLFECDSWGEICSWHILERKRVLQNGKRIITEQEESTEQATGELGSQIRKYKVHFLRVERRWVFKSPKTKNQYIFPIVNLTLF